MIIRLANERFLTENAIISENVFCAIIYIMRKPEIYFALVKRKYVRYTQNRVVKKPIKKEVLILYVKLNKKRNYAIIIKTWQRRVWSSSTEKS